MSDLGRLNYFLGISTTRTTSGLFLSQRKYASEILARAKMSNCKPCCAPAEAQFKLDASGPSVVVHLLLIPHFTVVLLALYSISHLRARIWLFRFSRSVYICMILVSNIF